LWRSSLACQHVFCDSCLSKITDGGSLSCPQCRRDSNVESFEAVEFTATEQWDQLLEIAQQFAAMEGRLGPETSEEEEEENLRENFIDDDEVEARFGSSLMLPQLREMLILGLVPSLGIVR